MLILLYIGFSLLGFWASRFTVYRVSVVGVLRLRV